MDQVGDFQVLGPQHGDQNHLVTGLREALDQVLAQMVVTEAGPLEALDQAMVHSKDQDSDQMVDIVAGPLEALDQAMDHLENQVLAQMVDMVAGLDHLVVQSLVDMAAGPMEDLVQAMDHLVGQSQVRMEDMEAGHMVQTADMVLDPFNFFVKNYKTFCLYFEMKCCLSSCRVNCSQ